MDITQTEQLVVSALEDIKAKDIQVIDSSRLSALFERVVIATGDSNRQTLPRPPAWPTRPAKPASVIGIEGEGTGEWVLVDLGSIVITSCSRPCAYYNLEELWSATPDAPPRRLSAP